METDVLSADSLIGAVKIAFKDFRLSRENSVRSRHVVD